MPEVTPAGATAGDRGAGDHRWSDVFGATPVGGTPYAIAVDGDAVWLGGDFTGVMAGMPDGTDIHGIGGLTWVVPLDVPADL